VNATALGGVTQGAHVHIEARFFRTTEPNITALGEALKGAEVAFATPGTAKAGSPG
jgi:hypothetical protein